MRKGFKVVCDICEMLGALVLGIKAALMMGSITSIWTCLIIVNMFTLTAVLTWDVGKGLISLAEK